MLSAPALAKDVPWDEAFSLVASDNAPLVADLLRWKQLRDADGEARAETIMQFVRTHPDWPDRERLLARARDALLVEGAALASIKHWLDLQPTLPEGSALRDSSTATLMRDFVRYAWVKGRYTQEEAQAIMQRFARYLGARQHRLRADRLIWERQYRAAARMVLHLSGEERKLFTARLALARSQRGVDGAVRAVPKRLRNDPGLLYERMKWRHRKKMYSGVRELLLSAPKSIPYPEKWWPVRRLHVREAIEDEDYTLAKKLLRNHGQTSGGPRADALWLAGWLELEFLKNPREAYKHFYALFTSVTYPVSKARGAYHAGRAAETNGNHAIAKSWYEIASAWPATYYGQLAAHALHGKAPLRMPADHSVSAAVVKGFPHAELREVVALLMTAGQEKLAVKFLNHLVDSADSPAQSVLAARTGSEIGSDYLSVKGGKRLMRKNLLDVTSAWPLPGTLPEGPLEPAMILAITRQESEFNAQAVSHAGASGLMQLMPGTAKLTARKLGLSYRRARLHEEAYNMQLGSAYLQQMIERFDGSYILAIAAYNAGPGNVERWLTRFGHPGDDLHEAALWVERIPFSETRNYVQRVLENLQIYRHLTAGSTTPQLRLAEDLTR